MKLNKGLWLSEEFSVKKKMPSWPCPICNTGILLKDGESIKQLYTEETNKAKRNIFYETDAKAEFRFIGYLKCSHCEERVVIGGNGAFCDEFGNPVRAMYVGRRISVFYPSYFEPALNIIELPSSISNQAREFIIKSFAMFWIDLDSCANKIRLALEQVVYEQNGTGKDLHSKIQSLRQQFGNSLTDALLAIKWIGNEGSHLGPAFTRDKILNAYELLHDALYKLYPDIEKESTREQLIKDINQNKGIKNL